jgi:hypothetical protein
MLRFQANVIIRVIFRLDASKPFEMAPIGSGSSVRIVFGQLEIDVIVATAPDCPEQIHVLITVRGTDLVVRRNHVLRAARRLAPLPKGERYC